MLNIFSSIVANYLGNLCLHILLSFKYFIVSNYLFLRGFVIAFLENTEAYMHDDACMTYGT